MLKRLDSGKWVHTVCALASSESEIEDFHRMNFSIAGYALKYPISLSCTCAICGSNRGYLLSCSQKGCKKTVHPFCAFQARAQDDSIPSKIWQILFELAGVDEKSLYPEISHYLQGDSASVMALCSNTGLVDSRKESASEPMPINSMMAAWNAAGRKQDRPVRGGCVRAWCGEHLEGRGQSIGKEKPLKVAKKSFVICCDNCGIST